MNFDLKKKRFRSSTSFSCWSYHEGKKTYFYVGCQVNVLLKLSFKLDTMMDEYQQIEPVSKTSIECF